MARPTIIEKTEAEVLAQATGKFFRPVYAQTAAIPAIYDGKYVSMFAVATNVSLTDTQLDALETAIEAITGVYKAHCLIGSARIPLDRVPVDHDLKIGIEGKFIIEPTPVVE